MISPEAQLLVGKCKELIVPDGLVYEEIEPAVNSLILPYEIEAWRRHHAVSHLTYMSDFLHPYLYELRNPRTVFMAMLGHDVVYQPWLYDMRLRATAINEKASEAFTRTLIAPFYAEDEVDMIGEYIIETAHHSTDVTDPDLKYLLDADMLILGANDQEFELYDERVKQEFLFRRPEIYKKYLEGRIHFLMTTNDKQIFCTEVAQDLYEKQAHINLGKTALRYQGELAVL